MGIIVDKAQKRFNKELKKYVTEQVDYVGSATRVTGEDFRGWMSPMNNKCHINALTTYKQDNKFEIIPCLYANGGEYSCHFINWCSSEDFYVDNSIGALSREYEYIIFKHNWLNEERLKSSPDSWLQWSKEDIKDIIFARMSKLDKWLLRNVDLV